MQTIRGSLLPKTFVSYEYCSTEVSNSFSLVEAIPSGAGEVSVCFDGQTCLNESLICDGFLGCENGEDETAACLLQQEQQNGARLVLHTKPRAWDYPCVHVDSSFMHGKF